MVELQTPLEADLKERLQENGAKKELAEIIERTVESAVEIAPSLAEDFRSEIFLNHVLVPAVLEFLLDPTSGLNEVEIAERYIEKFVAPFLRGRSTDETLAKIFLSDRETLRRAFAEFLRQLRPALYRSQHWPERMRDIAVEETRLAVLKIDRKLTPCQPGSGTR